MTSLPALSVQLHDSSATAESLPEPASTRSDKALMSAGVAGVTGTDVTAFLVHGHSLKEQQSNIVENREDRNQQVNGHRVDHDDLVH